MYFIPKFKSAQSKVIAREIETLTAQLGTKTPYILVGPGRWGTADPWLGIPVKWQQISGAKIIVEVGLPENEKLLALALFNVGVEIGQLVFVLSVVVLWLSCRWLFNYRVNMLRATAAYGSGAIAAFWFFDRVAQF